MPRAVTIIVIIMIIIMIIIMEDHWCANGAPMLRGPGAPEAAEALVA